MPAKLTLPSMGVLNRQFKYRRSEHTDISKTFARVRKAQRDALLQAAQDQQHTLDLEAPATVLQLPQRGNRGAA